MISAMAFLQQTIASSNGTQSEMIRRLRLGDLRKLFRDRYGSILPDDDAGREDLIELLLPISLGYEPDLKMRNAIEVWCPWMSQKETGEVIDRIKQMPLWQRKPKAELLGERLGLIYPDRTRLRIKTIAPIDVSREGMLWLRKQRDKERKRRQRQLRGARSRAEYRDNSITKTQPWIAAGFQTRRTWERYGKPVASPSAIKLPTVTEQLATPHQPPVSKAERNRSVLNTKPTPQTQKPEMSVIDTANELNGHTCDNCDTATVPEMFGHNGGPSMDELPATPEQDLRGMPRDLSCYYGRPSAQQFDMAA
jgi:hypothetical protein